MNERFEQLAQQATQEFSLAFESDKWQAKFAELVALECVSVCEDYAARVLKYSQFGSNGASDCANLIKQRFGLE